MLVIPTGVDAGALVALARERLERTKPVKRARTRSRWPRRPSAFSIAAAWAELSRS